MDFRQSTFQEILDSEREMVLRAEERFGTYYLNAFRLGELLTRSIKTVHLDSQVVSGEVPSSRGAKPFESLRKETPWLARRAAFRRAPPKHPSTATEL
jgi:hypothetical protein